MSAQREWKPGDVGVARTGGRFLVVRSGRCAWATLGGDYVVSGRPEATDRPLVVLDPEDAEQIDRLVELVLAHGYDFSGKQVADLAQALREFANLTPPKPDEPKGLGAVVEDRDGTRWVRAGKTISHPGDDWRAIEGDQVGWWGTYGDIKAVRVLSEGVTDAD